MTFRTLFSKQEWYRKLQEIAEARANAKLKAMKSTHSQDTKNAGK